MGWVMGIDIHRCPVCGTGPLHLIASVVPTPPIPKATGPHACYAPLDAVNRLPDAAMYPVCTWK
jgi:hypothetical protein